MLLKVGHRLFVLQVIRCPFNESSFEIRLSVQVLMIQDTDDGTDEVDNAETEKEDQSRSGVIEAENVEQFFTQRIFQGREGSDERIGGVR